MSVSADPVEPPNSTVLPRPLWKHIAGRLRGPGVPSVGTSVHVVPWYSQVWLLGGISSWLVDPPNNTTRERIGSKLAPYW